MNERTEIILSSSGKNYSLEELRKVMNDIELILWEEANPQIRKIIVYFPRIGQENYEYGVFYEKGDTKEYSVLRGLTEKIEID